MRGLFLCAVLLAGCHRAPPRVLHIQVAVGPELRSAGDWRGRVASRVRAAAAMLQPAGVQLELATVSEWEPDPKAPSELNRRVLAGYHSSGDWIDLGLYGATQANGEPGLAAPFDSRALVFETPGAAENQQAANMAHVIAHLLGAWHTRTGGSVMSLPPGSALDDTTARCLRLTEAVDLLQGPASLDQAAVKGLQDLWAASGQAAAGHPLYRAYTSRGMEEIARGQKSQAEADFAQAEQYASGLAAAHVQLGNAELANHEVLEGADEMRKALKLDPGSNDAMSGLAAALISTGHADEGIAILGKAVKTNPGDARAHANYGIILLGVPGRMDEGIAELGEAVRIDPGNESLKRSLEIARAHAQPPHK